MNRLEFKELLESDNSVYEEYTKHFRSKILLRLTCDHIVKIHKYLVLLRHCQYFKSQFESGRKTCVLPYVYYARKLNKLGNILGFYISPNAVIGKGFWIYHHGEVIINGNAIIGANCRLHGNNCIGNKGNSDDGSPMIGDNCDIGFGASILGDITIADNVKVAANATVVKSCDRVGSLLAGVPAREI